MTFCPTGKKQFRSRVAAIDFVKHVAGKKRNNVDQYPYLCECKWWHLTSELDGVPKQRYVAKRTY